MMITQTNYCDFIMISNKLYFTERIKYDAYYCYEMM